MNTIERDDFVHALGQTLAFYGKELDRMQTSFWITACADRGVSKLKAALLEHTKCSRYAPKPADVLALVDNMNQRSRYDELPAPPKTNCPPEKARAWMWFNQTLCAGSNLDGIFGAAEVDVDLQEKYLHIVNHEAHKYGTPEAIPEEFRLKEVWG